MLFRSLSFDVITLPPLRVREGDIHVLADHFGRRMATELRWELWPGFSEGALRALEEHQWPGNVRELRNVVERAVYRWDYWDQPIAHIVFDPFDSPWKPAALALPHSAEAPQQSGAQPVPPPRPQAFDAVDDLRGAVDAHEKAILEHALGRHRYNQRQTAKALGLSYDQLRHCLRKHGLMDRAQG